MIIKEKYTRLSSYGRSPRKLPFCVEGHRFLIRKLGDAQDEERVVPCLALSHSEKAVSGQS